MLIDYLVHELSELIVVHEQPKFKNKLAVEYNKINSWTHIFWFTNIHELFINFQFMVISPGICCILWPSIYNIWVIFVTMVTCYNNNATVHPRFWRTMHGPPHYVIDSYFFQDLFAIRFSNGTISRCSYREVIHYQYNTHEWAAVVKAFSMIPKKAS